MNLPFSDFGRAIAYANERALRTGVMQRVRVCGCLPPTHFTVGPVDTMPESVLR